MGWWLAALRSGPSADGSLCVAVCVFSHTDDGGGADGAFWVATWGGGIVSYIPGEDVRREARVVVHPATGEGDDRSRVLGMAWDEGQRRVWVASLDNLYAYDWRGGTLEAVDLEGILPAGKKILDQPVADRWGNVWVPGYSPHTFILSRPAEGIRRDPVAPMTDKTGYPVMVDCIAQDGDGYWIWQGRTGLSYYAPSEGRIFMTSEASGVRRSFSRVLAESRRGGGVYVSQDGRIMRLAWNAGRFAMTDLGTVPGQGGVLHKLLEGEGGCLWAATGDGLYNNARGQWRCALPCPDGVRDFLLLPGGGLCALSSDGNLYHSHGRGKTGCRFHLFRFGFGARRHRVGRNGGRPRLCLFAKDREDGAREECGERQRRCGQGDGHGRLGARVGLVRPICERV